MKKLFAALCMVFAASSAFAWGIPAIGDTGMDTGPLTKRAESVKEKVGTATLSLAEGLSDVMDMAGKAKEAGELRERVAALKSDRADFTKVEALSNAIGVGQKSLAGVALSKALPVAVAQAKLPSALFNITSAVATDISVTKETSDLAQEIPKAASSIKNPMKIKELTDAAGAIKFVATQIIPQAQSLGSIIKELSEYASANKIALK